MKFSNPLEMNDWRISSFILFSLVALGLLWSTIFLFPSGFLSPLLQPVVGSICLLYIPGIAVLRVFRVHKLGSVETPLYAVGISVSLVTFVGLLLNFLLPLVGISDPLSSSHLILAYSAGLVGLCIACYGRDKDYAAAPTHLRLNALSPGFLCLLLLPFVSIFGTYLVNNYEINGLILLLLLCIGAVVIIVASRKAADESMYPLAIFSTSLALLLSNTLISHYLWGWDVFAEANVANVVANHAVWNPAYAAHADSSFIIIADVVKYNSVLSISILAPVLMKICNIDATSLFKIVYPLIYALVPVALFQFFRRHVSAVAAFLASFYFVATGPFFQMMPGFAREEIAQLFLVLVLLLIFNTTFHTKTKNVLLVLFAGATIVSHYGTAYLFMLELMIVYVLLFVTDRGLWNIVKHPRNLAFWKSKGPSQSSPKAPSHTKIPLMFVVLFLIITLVWYAYAGGTTTVPVLYRALTHAITTNFLSSAGAETQARVQLSQTPLAVVTARLSTLGTLLILLGVLAAIKQRKEMRFDRAYLAFAVVGVGLVAVNFAVPAIAVEWLPGRVQHLALIVLAPFLIVGVVALFRVAAVIPSTVRRAREPTNDGLERKAYVFSAIFVAALLLFSSGFVFAAANEVMESPSLFYRETPFLVHRQDIAGATWLDHASNSSVVEDFFGASIIVAYSSYPVEQVHGLSPWARVDATDLIYVRSYDVAAIERYYETHQWVPNSNIPLDVSHTIYSQNFTGNMSKVYDSGCAIYGP
ncbi:MAG: DUF2206 domain-containing protein [Halobacteriota archaeon]